MWAMKAIMNMNFNDIRLNNRLFKITDLLSQHPEKSIPGACQTWPSTKGTYRFLNNESVTPSIMLEGISKSTAEKMRIESEETYLFISDATNLVFSSHKALKGAGVLRNQKARGLNLHTTLVVGEDGVPAGIANQHCWGRKEEDYGKRAQRAKNPIEEKESFRWIESLQASQECLPDGVKGIFMGDRGSDIYELFLQPRRNNMHLLIRALHNRTLTNSERLFQHINNEEPAGFMYVDIQRANQQPARIAQLEVRYKKVTFNPPKNKALLPQISLVIISAQEIIEDGEIANPIHWNLLTTLPINSLDQAIYAVRTYAKRWLIERFHFVLKQGCLVEKLQLREAESIKKAVAIFTMVACKIMHLTYAARGNPDLLCTHFFTDDEWKALYCYTNKKQYFPKQPPSLKEATLMLGKMGGFLARKSDGEPGLKVLWRGYRVLEGVAKMFIIMKEKNVGKG